MKLAFEVDGLPPKKDGANSMWGKGVAREPLKLLREGALDALQGGGSRLTKNIRLTLRVHGAYLLPSPESRRRGLREAG